MPPHCQICSSKGLIEFSEDFGDVGEAMGNCVTSYVEMEESSEGNFKEFNKLLIFCFNKKLFYSFQHRKHFLFFNF